MSRRDHIDEDVKAATTWEWFWPVGVVVILVAIFVSSVWPWGFAL